MNRKQLLILLVLVAVLGGAGWVLFQKQSAAWRAPETAGQKLLPNFPVNDVVRLRVQHGTNELNLVKRDDLWRVRERADYPANFNEVSEFLIKVRDLKVVQTEQIGDSQLGRVELLPPGPGTNTATLVEFLDKEGKALAGLLLGKKQMRAAPNRSEMDPMGDMGFPVGRFVRPVGMQGSVAVISDALANVEPKPEQWLNKDFFKVEKIKSVTVTFAEATNSWTLTRETESGEWHLANATADEQLDNAKASSATSGLGWPSFNDVRSKDTDAASVGLDTPTTARVQTFDDFTYTLKIGRKTDDNQHMTLSVSADLPKERTPGADEKDEDKERLDKEFKERLTKLSEKLANEKKLEGWVYQVSGWTFDSLLKPRAELLAEKKADSEAEEGKDNDDADAADDAK